MPGSPGASQSLTARGLVSEALVEPIHAIARETNRSLPEVLNALLRTALLVMEAERSGAEVVVRDGEREMAVRVRLPLRRCPRLSYEGAG